MTDNVYDAARAVLREKGWCQRIAQEVDGSMCLMGSLAVAQADGDVAAMHFELGSIMFPRSPVRALLEQVIAEQWPDTPRDGIGGRIRPWHWNDAPERTAADVDAVLDKAGRIHDERAS